MLKKLFLDSRIQAAVDESSECNDGYDDRDDSYP
jgi:hypothetical protein